MLNSGKRIAIIGPSSSGKSTLAVALGAALDIPVFHLDQYVHEAETNWRRVPDEQFCAAHNDLVRREEWIIEGNYSVCMRPRFARATGVIWLDPPLPGCIWRYIRRCRNPDIKRAGDLEGAARQFNWGLIKYTLVDYPKNREKYRRILQDFPGLNVRIFKKPVSLDDLCG